MAFRQLAQTSSTYLKDLPCREHIKHFYKVLIEKANDVQHEVCYIPLVKLAAGQTFASLRTDFLCLLILLLGKLINREGLVLRRDIRSQLILTQVNL